MNKLCLSIATLMVVAVLFAQASRARNVSPLNLPEGAKGRLGSGWVSGGVAYSHDGARLAVPTSIGIWLYDLHGDAKPTLIRGHKDAVLAVSFSQDGQTVTSMSDGTFQSWDAASGEHRSTREGYPFPGLHAASFSPDGRILASGMDQGAIGLSDVESGELQNFLGGHRGDVGFLAFSPDGGRLASTEKSQNPTVKVWNLDTGEPIVLDVRMEYVLSLSFSHDGQTLAIGGLGDGVQLWDVNARRLETTFEASLSFALFSPAGQTLAVAGQNKIDLWDVQTRQLKSSLEWHTQWIKTLSFSGDGRALAGIDYDGNVRWWDLVSGQFKEMSQGPALGPVHNVSFSPDGQNLASASWNIWLWDVARSRLLATFDERHRYPVIAIAFSADGETVATGDQEGQIRLWGVARGKLMLEQNLEATRPISALAFSPDGSTVASGGGVPFGTPGLRLWDVATGQLKATLEHTDPVEAVAFSPDGLTLASGSAHGAVGLWDVSSGRNEATRDEHWDSVSSLSFSRDGSKLASGSWNKVGLWTVDNGQLHIETILEHTGQIHAVAFSRDGSILVTGGGGEFGYTGDADTGLRLWDVATGRLKAALEGHSMWIHALAISRNGQTLASASDDGTILLWDMSPYVVSRTPLPDFDGDGTVGFVDFLLFAGVFGLSQDDAGYEARFDLDEDGAIGFGDFLIFAASFGQGG